MHRFCCKGRLCSRQSRYKPCMKRGKYFCACLGTALFSKSICYLSVRLYICKIDTATSEKYYPSRALQVKPWLESISEGSTMARIGIWDFEIHWIYVDFGFQIWFLDFQVDFWISKWICGFQMDILDFKVDSGFCLNFINLKIQLKYTCDQQTTSSLPRCTQNTMTLALHRILHAYYICNYVTQKNDLCTRLKIGRVQRSFTVCWCNCCYIIHNLCMYIRVNPVM